MKMNLQYFAEPEPADPQQEPEKLELTQEELDAKINSEYDRRLAKQQAKWDEQLKRATEDAKNNGLAEGQKRAKMSAKEKADEEQKQREEALSKRESELNKRELTANVTDMLNEKGLPKDLAESLVSLGDADKIGEVVETLQKSTEKQVNEQVKERMRQDAPVNGESNLSGTDDPFQKIMNSYK